MRGWFRQDDFPQNEVLYDKLTAATYLRWLHRMSVRYVVVTDAAPDYSARHEIALLRGGRSGLPVVHVVAERRRVRRAVAAAARDGPGATDA